MNDVYGSLVFAGCLHNSGVDVEPEMHDTSSHFILLRFRLYSEVVADRVNCHRGWIMVWDQCWEKKLIKSHLDNEVLLDRSMQQVRELLEMIHIAGSHIQLECGR